MSLARPPVAAMFPAVSEASEVVSRFSVAPIEAMSWPFLSTRKTILALASRASRSQTVLICWNSSSYITIDGPDIDQPRPELESLVRTLTGDSTLVYNSRRARWTRLGVLQY